jgi:DNA-binding MarR family transcriptional regulator
MTEDREHQQDGHGGGGITLGELAERLGISIGYAADTVAGLMEMGLIREAETEEDQQAPEV